MVTNMLSFRRHTDEPLCTLNINMFQQLPIIIYFFDNCQVVNVLYIILKSLLCGTANYTRLILIKEI